MMYCPKCGRWIDRHEETEVCKDEEKCAARQADPNYPLRYSASIVIRSSS